MGAVDASRFAKIRRNGEDYDIPNVAGPFGSNTGF